MIIWCYLAEADDYWLKRSVTLSYLEGLSTPPHGLTTVNGREQKPKREYMSGHNTDRGKGARERRREKVRPRSDIDAYPVPCRVVRPTSENY